MVGLFGCGLVGCGCVSAVGEGAGDDRGAAHVGGQGGKKCEIIIDILVGQVVIAGKVG